MAVGQNRMGTFLGMRRPFQGSLFLRLLGCYRGTGVLTHFHIYIYIHLNNNTYFSDFLVQTFFKALFGCLVFFEPMTKPPVGCWPRLECSARPISDRRFFEEETGGRGKTNGFSWVLISFFVMFNILNKFFL